MPHGSGSLSASDSFGFTLLWASQTELGLRNDLPGHDFIWQLGLRTDEWEKLERLYGVFLSAQLSTGDESSYEQLFNDTAALMAVALAYHAARVDNPATFVEDFLTSLDLEVTEELLAALNEAALKSLAEFGLKQLGEDSDLSLLFTHTIGMAHREVPQLLALIDAQVAGIDPAELDAAAITETVIALVADSDDTPIEQENEDGTITELPAALSTLKAQLALDPETTGQMIKAIVELTAFTLTKPETWLDKVVNEQELPVHIFEAVVAELRERPAGTASREEAVGVAMRERRPRLVLDANRQKLCLRLPEQRVAAADEVINWRVSLGGTTKIYQTQPAWGSVTHITEVLDISLDHQVRDVTVTDVTTDVSWVVPVVDAADPILIFTPKGQYLSDKVTLHYPELIVVSPDNAALVDVVTGNDIVATETFPIEGWNGWIARRIDCADLLSLQLVPAGQTASALLPLRVIDPRQRVTFHHPDALIKHVYSPTGLPVYSESLVVEFPPTVSGRDELWHLSISAFAGADHAGEEVAPAEPLHIPADGGSFEVFDPTTYDAPWVGEYLVRLRGPRNESFRHEFAIVEGMLTTTEISGIARGFRIPSQGGLSETHLIARAGAKPMTITPRDIVVAPQEAGVDFQVTTDEGDQMPLRFNPPRLRFDLPLADQPAMWRTTRLVTAPRSFDANGEIRIRATGAMGQPKVSVRNHHGAPMRTVSLNTEDDLTYTTPARPIAETLASMLRGRVEFEWTDPTSNKRVSVNLAEVDNVPHAIGVEFKDGALVFQEVAPGRQLGAWVWQLTAPWSMATSVPVVDGVAKLPQGWEEPGKLAVQLFSADPFSLLRAPISAGASAFMVDAPGFAKSPQPALNQLSEFLAGETEEAPTDASVMPLLWDFLVEHTGDSEVAASTRAAMVQVLAASPAAALQGLSASLVPAERQPGRVISAGLMGGIFEPNPDSESVHRAAWIGTLELIAGLTKEFAEVEAGKPKADMRAMLEELEQLAGRRLVETLMTGRDVTLDSACVDQSTVSISQMPATSQAAVLDMFFSQAELVPGPIMDDNARLLAIFEVFKKRAALNELFADEVLVKSAVSLLRAMRGANRQLYSAARVRFDKLDGVNTDEPQNMWALAPVVSMVFALSARMHAHGLIGKSKVLEAAAPGWAKLADIVPDLVTGDIISADAMVVAVSHPGIGD